MTEISIHALLAESDESAVDEVLINEISIHALLAESDRRHRGNDGRPIHFYPRSPCGERPFEKFEGLMVTKISIHALLAESDTQFSQKGQAK